MTDEYIRRQDMLNAVEQLDIIPSVDGMGIPTGAEDFRVQFLGTVLKVEPADVAPVVHGKWIDHDGNKVQLNEHGETCGTCFCNQCGEWLVASDEYAVKGYFCPNCGAKMDKE